MISNSRIIATAIALVAWLGGCVLLCKARFGPPASHMAVASKR